MPNLSYDDQQFQMLFREYLGGVKDLGGAASEVCPRWYPKGPIKVKKIGLVIEEAFTGTGTNVEFYKSGTSSIISSIACSTTIAAGIASSTSLTASSIPAGGYVAVIADGTGDTGKVMAFIDYVRTYDTNFAL